MLRGEQVLVRQRFAVVAPPPVTLSAPARVAVGTTFQVAWTGPYFPNDAIGLVEPHVEDAFVRSINVNDDAGSLPMDAPTKPGTYELCYRLGRVRTLARKTIEVFAP